jgi:hypothetical protein
MGGLREALARSVLYVGIARGRVDERGWEYVRRAWETEGDMARLTLSEFKSMLREQFLMLHVDPKEALAAIPRLLPPDAKTRQSAFAAIEKLLRLSGDLTGQAATRLEEIKELIGVGPVIERASDISQTIAPLARTKKNERESKAS